jgi:hypothetical protein
MAENTGASLINLGQLTKPAEVLIEKISDAIGGIFRPHQIRRIAQAEAEAEKIRAVSQIEITEIQRRAMYRFFSEEGKKQANIESITNKALADVTGTAEPQNVEDDWITNFFAQCRLISDQEMQTLWAKLLSGEANRPGTYSKRTVNLLASMDKSDAETFKELCSFGWVIGNIVPLVYATDGEIYGGMKTWGTLKHLESIGLISFDPLAGYVRRELPKRIRVLYYGRAVTVEFTNESDNSLNLGFVLLTKVGQELAPMSGALPKAKFLDYIISKWRELGYVVTT